MTIMKDRIESLSILGVGVSVLDSYEHALELVRNRIATRSRTFCVAINPEKIQKAAKDVRLQRVLASTDIQLSDGVGVVLAAKLLYGKTLARCTGVDLFLRLLRAAPAEGWKVFLLGASPESNESASEALQRSIPGLTIAGRHHGYFTDSKSVVDAINASGADLLFVALGSPRQEFWISDNLDRLNTPFVMGVGGTLDVVSGSAMRAPALVRKLGLEWLHRLISQPTRARRQTALPAFAFSVIKCALFESRPSLPVSEAPARERVM